MLRLTHEQLALIDQLLLKRHAAGIAAALGEAWPAVAERLKERWPAFVEAALQNGHRFGLEDPAELAALACLWCIWGASFDEKPGFDWACEILADVRRGPALKVHQLLHRTRDELQRQRAAVPGAAPVVSVAQFDTALALVADRMAGHAIAKAVFVDTRPAPPVKACDLGVVDLVVAEVEVQEYRPVNGAWPRVAAPRLAPQPEHWTRAPDEPLALAVTSHALRGGTPARLNLKVEALAVCDPRVHPEIVHASAQGRLAWKGRDAARLSLALYAPSLPPTDPKHGPPGIAARTEPDAQQVQLASCGLRDAGAPFGAVDIALRVYPAVQWLHEIRHAAFPTMTWPMPTGGEPTMAPAPVGCRLEADGAPRDAIAWQRGWGTLQPKFRSAFAALFNAWSRGMDLHTARLDVEAAPLSGQAGLTWGWRRTEPDAVQMRTEAVLELLACALDVKLVGTVAIGDAKARVTLSCKGRSELRMVVAQIGDASADGQGLADVKRSFRYPFVADVDTLVAADLATLHAGEVADGMLGALTGECGLRQRPDGLGLQWYFTLRLEPVTLAFVSADPVLGATRHLRTLLPAMPLVDWSAG
jgi:hypothetical protein